MARTKIAAIPRPTYAPVLRFQPEFDDESELEFGVDVAIDPIIVGFAPAAV
jgi:hypothetical protein